MRWVRGYFRDMGDLLANGSASKNAFALWSAIIFHSLLLGFLAILGWIVWLVVELF